MGWAVPHEREAGTQGTNSGIHGAGVADSKILSPLIAAPPV